MAFEMDSPAPTSPQFLGEVQLQPSLLRRSQISHVVFDFDGTLSWLRHGWPSIMLDVFDKHFPTSNGESASARKKIFLDIVLGMNGKPTLMQMIRFAELARDRATVLDPETLRREYQDRLDQEIAARAEKILRKTAQPDEFVVFSARPLLEKLRRMGMVLYILSSTVEPRVKEEAKILQLAPFFENRIYGGTGDPAKFSKKAIFQKILRQEKIGPANLLSFGDGPVEIATTKELGGTAIAVCSDEEHNGSGVMDPFKRSQLLDAGADAAIPDFRDAGALVDHIKGGV